MDLIGNTKHNGNYAMQLSTQFFVFKKVFQNNNNKVVSWVLSKVIGVTFGGIVKFLCVLGKKN